MQWDLSEDNKVLILRSATALEIDQTNMYFTREAANAKWDPRVKKGYWDGKISYFKSNKYLPAGFWYELTEMGKKYDFPVKISGIERKFDFEIDKEEFQKWVEENWTGAKKIPRQYQIDAAFNIIKYKSSLSELATSAGKTLITYMVIAYLLKEQKSKKILMIVPSVDLVVQSSDDFYQYNNESLKLKLDIQQIYAGSILRANCPIIIGTFQSLVKKDSDYFDSFDTIVCDECLHPDTLITLSDNSVVKIKDINIGDKVLTSNDVTGETEINEVDFVYKNLTKSDKLYVIELENGKILKLTGNHKIKLTDGSYKRADCLTVNDDILTI